MESNHAKLNWSRGVTTRSIITTPKMGYCVIVSDQAGSGNEYRIFVGFCRVIGAHTLLCSSNLNCPVQHFDAFSIIASLRPILCDRMID